jgi:Rne/Rng family ribonuclease
MTKELFVTSTPHETKVGLVEDDQLAEIYLERENEYTLAGSIYKGRVTRVLPGMQSAFVDIGLERDAFLYVSDFMELEEHDEDLTDVVPVGRSVADIRPPQPQAEVAAPPTESSSPSTGPSFVIESESFNDDEEERPVDSRPVATSEPIQSHATPEEREPRGWRGRRRRRGRRGDRGGMPESRFARPASDAPEPSRTSERPPRSDYGPPPGYQPILLPGESISKYRGLQGRPVTRPEAGSATIPDKPAPVSEVFAEDEPIFAEQAESSHLDPSAALISQETHDEPKYESPAQEHRQSEEITHAETRTHPQVAPFDWRRDYEPAGEAGTEEFAEEDKTEAEAGLARETDSALRAEPPAHGQQPNPFSGTSAAFGAAPGMMEEEEIEEEEEADISSYVEELDEDAQFEELEEETQEATGSQEHRAGEIAAAQEPSEGFVPSVDTLPAEAGAADQEIEEEDLQEAEVEEAQEEAEALLDAEAGGGNGEEIRAEVRAPAATAGYQQRTQRRGFDRRGRGGRRGNGGRRFSRRPNTPRQPTPLISDLLKEGQEILVQIAKEPIGKKGARITSHIALPGRFLVFMPTVNHTGVSRKIASDEERMRLKRIVLSERENGQGGFIVRTAAQGAAEEELRADIRFLKNLWNEIKARAENGNAPALIYHDLNVVERVLRDQVTSDFSQIWVDTEQEYERILRFANRFQPALVRRVKLYSKETPLFEQFGLTEEINKALKSKVWLKSGGYIVINQTEALVAIDINTGKYVGKTSRLEDTIVKTNVDAIKEIVRQIRLRDLGGIIIIDFIDMDERRNRQRVMQALEEALRGDRAPSKVLQFNDFGLVAITRKRVKQSLERTIGTPCPYCTATGYVKSVTTICNEIYVEMRKISKHLEHSDVMLRVNPEVAKVLKSNNGRWLTEMEELTGKTIIVKSDPALHQEQFDVN